MAIEPGAPTLTHLERLDLGLAARIVPLAAGLEVQGGPETLAEIGTAEPLRQRPAAAVICGLLELRGLELRLGDVQDVLSGRPGRLQSPHQEAEFVLGLSRCLGMISARAQSGVLPDGAFALDLFEAFAHRIVRFRNNSLRHDMPWDGLMYLSYPPAADVGALLGSFANSNCYRDVRVRFSRLHPVRQSFRVLWRLCRISPFPDFNLLMGFLFMNTFLLVRGYPALTAMPGDRELLRRVITGPPPTRLLAFEARLADAI
jgi:hypothetical protein